MPVPVICLKISTEKKVKSAAENSARCFSPVACGFYHQQSHISVFYPYYLDEFLSAFAEICIFIPLTPLFQCQLAAIFLGFLKALDQTTAERPAAWGA